MATGGSDRSVDSRVVCSVCLEPYRGRQPKLLPCFHTFCLPCLSQLAHPQVSDGTSPAATDEGEEKTGTPSITCPTCRNIIPVPPGGVAHFQSNFYVDDDSTSPSPAGDTATEQNIDEDDELQEKVKAQVKVMEAVLARLDEEAGEINRQKRTMDHDIQTRYAEALRHIGEARDHCFESLRDAVQAAQDKLDAERSMAETKLHSLSQLANQTSVSRQMQASAVVLKDGALRHFQQLAHKTQPKTYFAFNSNDNVTPSLVDCLEQFMGSVLPFGHTAGDLDVRAIKPPDDIHAEYLDLLTNANLRHDVTALQTDVEKFRQELASLQTEKTELQKDVATLQADNMKLRQDLFTENSRMSKEIGSQHANTTRLSTAMTAVQKDVSHIQTEQKKTTTDVAALQKDVLDLQTDNRKMVTDVGTVQTHVDKLTQDLTAAQRTVTDTQGDTSALRKDLVSSQGEITSLQKTLSSIQNLQAKSGSMVAFHAVLSTGMMTSEDEPQDMILDNVLTNLGGGYDPRTSSFTAPVSGIYIFMVTANPVLIDGKFVLTIHLEDRQLGQSRSHGMRSGTGNVVLEVTAGQCVWIEFNDGAGGVFCVRESAHFSGVLVQAKLQ